MSLDIVLNKIDRVHHAGDTVRGVVKITTKGPLSHNGIQLIMQGDVGLQLSTKSVGIFEAFLQRNQTNSTSSLYC